MAKYERCTLASHLSFLPVDIPQQEHLLGILVPAREGWQAVDPRALGMPLVDIAQDRGPPRGLKAQVPVRSGGDLDQQRMGVLRELHGAAHLEQDRGLP